MDFLGHNGWCAPRLKDAPSLRPEQLRECYLDLCIYLRRMYHDCNLVHGDLSEYNVLWHKERVHVIDVSQSVERAHPYARELLQKDVANVSDFFRKKSMTDIISNYQLFKFVVMPDFSSFLPSGSTSMDEEEEEDGVTASVIDLNEPVEGVVMNNAPGGDASVLRRHERLKRVLRCYIDYVLTNDAALVAEKLAAIRDTMGRSRMCSSASPSPRFMPAVLPPNCH